MPILFLILLFICGGKTGFAQSDTTYSPIATVVFLDSFVVTAQRQGFAVEDFIELVQTDESFYTAFKNLRFATVDFTNQMTFFDRKGRVTATYQSIAEQQSDGRCRTMELQDETATGNFFKNRRKRKYRYYTAKMYDRIFYTAGKQCGDPFADGYADNLTGLDKHINELKKLIFQPGQPVNVPIIGKKTQIFSEELMPYYNYAIRSKSYQNRRDCYVFTAEVKPDQTKKADKTVIKFLETYFDKETFQVVARRYQLKYFGLAFDFNVTMEIELQQVKNGSVNQYLPQKITYDGWWDIPARKPEIGQFTLEITNVNNEKD